MAQPVTTVTLGGTDISTYVAAPKGTATITWDRGASFDGARESPGEAVILVENPDRRFTPTNASSPIIGVLKFGKKVRITAVHSATTYYLFDGFLRNIKVRDDGFAEIHAQDALYYFSRRETSIGASWTRSVQGFRAAIMSDIGVSGTNLAAGPGGEAMVGYGAADHANVLDLLSDLNVATGTVHYVKPTSAGYDYTTVDRTTFEKATSVEDWVDTDFSQPFAEQLGGTDYSDERLVNFQRVRSNGRDRQDPRSVVWTKRRWTVNASSSEERYAELDIPVTGPSLQYTTVAGSPTTSATSYGQTVKLTVTAGAAAVELRDIELLAITYPEAEQVAAKVDDSTSISTYGLYKGNFIESDHIPSESWAAGLASYIVWRNKDAGLVPQPVFVNRFPTQLAREVGDVVRITSSELGTSLARFAIRGHSTAVTNDGGEWRTTYTLEQLPAALTLFTIGGSAGEGVGGTGILGY